jgi:hypothetical protein
MAGWLKFEDNLPEKPETLAITAAMGWDDPDLAVGKLMRLFRWFDQQTVDGNARGVTPALLDRIIGVSGFVQAVANAGWLVITNTGLSLHNFDRHNGATAKSRAQTAKRVANHRADAPSNANSNASTVTPALAREEKKREEKEKETSPAAQVVAEPPAFQDFWNHWPKSTRKGGKVECLKLWRGARFEAQGAVIVDHVKTMAQSDEWLKESGRYVPAPIVYLRGKRWDGAELDGSRSAFEGVL